MRCQDLVLRDELQYPATITRWEWFASSFLSEGAFTNFSVRLCHTGRSALVEDFLANYGGNQPVIVYYAASQNPATTPYTWFGFDFQTPFAYNGNENLIVEVEWKGKVGSPATMTYWTKRHRACALAVASPTPPVVHDKVHYMRITVTAEDVRATSLGRVKTLFR